MRRVLVSLIAVLVLVSCAQKREPQIVVTPLMEAAKTAGIELYGDKLTFTNIFEYGVAVCGTVIKADKEQSFIYVRNKFILQEISLNGEWDAMWFTECDP